MKDAITLVAEPEFDKLETGTTQQMRLALRLEAGDAPAERERPPMSVVFVLDVSGSMAGEPLAHMIDAVARLVEFLDPNDRVGVVSFGSSAQVVQRVRRASSEHLEELVDNVRGLDTMGCTNMSGGLELAHSLLPERDAHERQLLLLLSDGHPNEGIRDALGLAGLVSGWEGYVSVATLGLGRHHDAQMLQSIAEAGEGRYHFIANPLVAEYEFASALGTQQAMVGEEVEVIFAPGDGVEVEEVGGPHKSTIKSDGLHLGVRSMAANSTRLLVPVLEVDVPREWGSFELASVRLRYLPVGANEPVEVSQTVEVRASSETGEARPSVVADATALAAEKVRRKAREYVERGQQAQAAAMLAECIERIEEILPLDGEPGDILTEILEALRDEHEMVKFQRHEEYDEYSRYNAAPLHETVRASCSHSLVVGRDAPEEVVAQVEVVGGPNAGVTFDIGREAVIGRSGGADITIADSNISRRHVQFIVYDGRCLVRDLGSTNGAYINGKRVTGAQALGSRDKLYVGDHIFEVRVNAPAEADEEE